MGQIKKEIVDRQRVCPGCAQLISVSRVVCPMCRMRVYRALVELEGRNKHGSREEGVSAGKSSKGSSRAEED